MILDLSLLEFVRSKITRAGDCRSSMAGDLATVNMQDLIGDERR